MYLFIMKFTCCHHRAVSLIYVLFNNVIWLGVKYRVVDFGDNQPVLLMEIWGLV